jgi:hypothetical protein
MANKQITTMDVGAITITLKNPIITDYTQAAGIHSIEYSQLGITATGASEAEAESAFALLFMAEYHKYVEDAEANGLGDKVSKNATLKGLVKSIG